VLRCYGGRAYCGDFQKKRNGPCGENFGQIDSKSTPICTRTFYERFKENDVKNGLLLPEKYERNAGAFI